MNKEKQLKMLIETYQNLVFSLCYKITYDYFTAEDLAQETFLSVYHNLDSFSGANEKAWICKIATNKCLDYLKHSERRNLPTEDIYFETLITKEDSPEAVFLAEEVEEQLRSVCKRLKPPYAHIADLYFIKGWNANEIANEIGCNIKTVQTRIYRARELLKKYYRKE